MPPNLPNDATPGRQTSTPSELLFDGGEYRAGGLKCRAGAYEHVDSAGRGDAPPVIHAADSPLQSGKRIQCRMSPRETLAVWRFRRLAESRGILCSFGERIARGILPALGLFETPKLTTSRFVI